MKEDGEHGGPLWDQTNIQSQEGLFFAFGGQGLSTNFTAWPWKLRTARETHLSSSTTWLSNSCSTFATQSRYASTFSFPWNEGKSILVSLGWGGTCRCLLVWGDCLGKWRCKSSSSPLRSWWCVNGGREDLGEAWWVCGGFLNCLDMKCKLACMAAIWSLMSLTSLVSLWSIRRETSPSSSALVLCCVGCGEFYWVCTLARVALLVLMIDMI